MGQLLEDSLVEFFKRTTVSCAIVKTLTEGKEPRKFSELMEGVSSILEGQIPNYAVEGAVRSSLKLLKSSGWVVKSEEGFHLTELGQELAGRIA